MEFLIMPFKSTLEDIVEESGFDDIEMRSDLLLSSKAEAEAAIEASETPIAVRFKHVALDSL